jgi:hypothetical protein
LLLVSGMKKSKRTDLQRKLALVRTRIRELTHEDLQKAAGGTDYELDITPCGIIYTV